MSIVVTTQGAASESNADQGDVQEQQQLSASEKDENIEESDTQKDSEDNESNDESNDQDDQDEEKEESEENNEKPKKKSGFKKRIDKLNKKLSVKDQEIEYWRKEALKQKNQDVEKPQQKTFEVDKSSRPSPDDFDDHDDYIEALTDWKLDQKLTAKEKAAKENELKTEYQTQVQTFQSKVKDFAEKTDDFEDVIESVDDIVVSPAIQELLFSSENGPELMYEIAKDREEYIRINSLSPLQAAKELGKIELRLSKPSPTKKEVKITQAPRPLKTVGSKGKGSAKNIYDPTLSQSEYERLRMEQMKTAY